MHKLFKVLLIVLLVTFILLIVGCAHKNNNSETVGLLETENNVEFTELYNLPIGFDEIEFKSIPKDTILMLKEEEINQFNIENFLSRDLCLGIISDDKAELFMQFKGDKSTSEAYEITNITAKGNKLTINLQDWGIMCIKPAEEFNGIFKTVIIVELDREFLSEDMELVVAISELSK